VRLAQTRERAERDRVVAAEHDRHEACARVVRDESSDSLTRRLDLRKEAGLLVAYCGGFRHGSLDVPAIDDLVAELSDPGGEACIANRRRTHVNAAAAGAEVERRTDNGHLSLSGL
jgi:hypothetical protein